MFRTKTPSYTIVHETCEFVVRGRDVYQRVIFHRGDPGQLRQGLRYAYTMGADQ